VPKEVQELFLKKTTELLAEDGILIISTPNDQLLRDISFGNYKNEFHVCEFLTEEAYLEFLMQYYPYIKIFYQTVMEASAILPKGKAVSQQSQVISMAPENEMGRYYIAVCSQKEIPENFSIQSVLTPKPKDYFDERYFTKYSIVHIDEGHGFEGKKFATAKYVSRTGKTFSCHFDFSDFQNIKALRFDPCEHGCACIIKKTESNIQAIELIPFNADRKDGEKDVFLTLDPIYLVEGENINEIKWLKLEGEIEEYPDYMILAKMDGDMQKKDAENNYNYIQYMEEKKNLDINTEYLN
jgi:hypothetical protein